MTYHPYDLMIEGKGFFPVQMPNGEVAYSRSGAFHLDAQGRLTQSNGSLLIPNIIVPANAANFKINSTGEVRVVMPNQGEAILGQIQLINFPNEQGLTAMGEGLYKPTLASGAPGQTVPGENGTGVIQQGALEGSNVNVANSMVEMIGTQRAYEMNTKVMGVADSMWGATANIK
jgi:flagellar basal-body rod protein FlgG